MKTKTDYERLVAHRQARDVAVEAAGQAARLIRAHAGHVEAAAVREKGLHDLVSYVDEQAQQAILEVLQAAYPGYAVLAEEGAADVLPAAEAESYRWIIDPLDGTTNFTHGVPPYAVSIALQYEAEVIVGVVLDVTRDELFTAVRGGGCYANGRRCRVSGAATLGESLLTTGFPYRSFGHLDAYLDVLRTLMQQTRGIRRPGAAAVDLAYIACGRFDGFFETGLMPWDVAAGALLVEEAGGRVSDYRDVRNPFFEGQILATNGRLHPVLLQTLAALRDIRG